MNNSFECSKRTDITEQPQSHDLLIANGNETANLLRHRQITRSTPTILQLSRNAKATGKKLTQSYQLRRLPFVPLVTLMRW